MSNQGGSKARRERGSFCWQSGYWMRRQWLLKVESALGPSMEGYTAWRVLVHNYNIEVSLQSATTSPTPQTPAMLPNQLPCSQVVIILEHPLHITTLYTDSMSRQTPSYRMCCQVTTCYVLPSVLISFYIIASGVDVSPLLSWDPLSHVENLLSSKMANN